MSSTWKRWRLHQSHLFFSSVFSWKNFQIDKRDFGQVQVFIFLIWGVVGPRRDFDFGVDCDSILVLWNKMII